MPAEEACLPLYRKVLSRLGSDDDLESNASTFTVEMREAAFILEEVGPRSLVLIDELGRGSSNLCGISIATAISERLVRSAVLAWARLSIIWGMNDRRRCCLLPTLLASSSTWRRFQM